MKGLLIDTVLLSVCGSFLCSLLGEESKLKRYAGFITSIAVVISVLSPVACFLAFLGSHEIPDIPIDPPSTGQATSTIQEWIVKQTDIGIRSSLAGIALSRFDIPLKTDDITIEYNTDSYTEVEIVSVSINVSDIYVIRNLNEFRDYVRELLMCECEVLS